MSILIVHVGLSVIGIFAGFMQIVGNIRSNITKLVFLASTGLTALTGFFLPVEKIMPSHIIGVITLVALAIACYSLYVKKLHWRWIKFYIVSSMLALYLNVFVAIVQAFLKISFLHTIAPSEKSPTFIIAHATTLILFIFLAWFLLKKQAIRAA